jgi:transcriptional regulator with GAF, ATPase, and Fis domain
MEMGGQGSALVLLDHGSCLASSQAQTASEDCSGKQGYPVSIQGRLALVVFPSMLLAALSVCLLLFWFAQARSQADVLHRSEEMVQATSLAFSQALKERDMALLDALLHEFRRRQAPYVRSGYVVDQAGRVLAHLQLDQVGRHYPPPELLRKQPSPRLSEVIPGESGAYRIVSLLQMGDGAAGALVLDFSLKHVADRLLSEMLWAVTVVLLCLLLPAWAVMAFGRRMVLRLKCLQKKALEMGQGGEPVAVSGVDEITAIGLALSQIQRDLERLRPRDQMQAKTIESLDAELRQQHAQIEQLRQQLSEENRALREQMRDMCEPDEIIGAQGGLHELMAQAKRVATLPVTVLITGESGTGKELLASHLHRNSPRSSGPFITVNCAALPSTLVESELFGHEKGAFTGAVSRHKGKFELAQGGTLFLDEIAELPLEAQAKLLRALQERKVCRLGGEQPIPVDVRVMAATNRDLGQAVDEGRFRADLYYRLKVVELRCPPLREWLQDLPKLVQHFIEQYARKLERPVVGITPKALELLSHYRWPGNVRELENTIARAIALATTQVLGPNDVALIQAPTHGTPPTLAAPPSLSALLSACGLCKADMEQGGLVGLLRACERTCLEAVVCQCRTQKEAAQVLGLHPTKMHRLLRKHGLHLERNASVLPSA